MRIPILFAVLALLPPRLNAGAGQWTLLGLADQTVGTISIDPSDPSRIYAAANPAGQLRSTDGGGSWIAIDTSQFGCHEASAVFVDAGHSNILFAVSECLDPLYLTYSGGLYRSTDTGTTWGFVFPNGIGLVQSPTDPSVALAVGWGFVYAHPYIFVGSVGRTVDDGATWTGAMGEAADNTVAAIRFAPSNPSVVYVGYAVDAFREPGIGVFKSTDAGITWASLADGGLPTNAVVGLDVSPSNSDLLLASVSTFGLQTSGRGVYRSTDGGMSWAPSGEGLGDLYPGSILFDPHDPTRAYLLTSGGVFRSQDGGQSWQPMNEGLGSVSVASLQFDPAGTTLYAGTSAGIYTINPSTGSACTADAQTLCLANGRFQVRAQWTDFQGNSGLGSVPPGISSNSSGLFWFFGSNNWELLIKVLNGCGVNGHYWVFGAAATNVEHTIQVTDTQTGEVKTYTNPLGTTSPAITDTEAFGACP